MNEHASIYQEHQSLSFPDIVLDHFATPSLIQDKAREEPNAIIVCDKWNIIHWNTTHVRVAPMERKIFVQLVSAHGNTVSKEEIAAHLYDVTIVDKRLASTISSHVGNVKQIANQFGFTIDRQSEGGYAARITETRRWIGLVKAPINVISHSDFRQHDLKSIMNTAGLPVTTNGDVVYHFSIAPDRKAFAGFVRGWLCRWDHNGKPENKPQHDGIVCSAFNA